MVVEGHLKETTLKKVSQIRCQIWRHQPLLFLSLTLNIISGKEKRNFFFLGHLHDVYTYNWLASFINSHSQWNLTHQTIRLVLLHELQLGYFIILGLVTQLHILSNPHCIERRPEQASLCESNGIEPSLAFPSIGEWFPWQTILLREQITLLRTTLNFLATKPKIR